MDTVGCSCIAGIGKSCSHAAAILWKVFIFLIVCLFFVVSSVLPEKAKLLSIVSVVVLCNYCKVESNLCIVLTSFLIAMPIESGDIMKILLVSLLQVQNALASGKTGLTCTD